MALQNFALDPQIEADSLAVVDLQLSLVRLMRDANYPWLLLIPRRSGVVELTDLDGPDRQQLMAEILSAAVALKSTVACDKINIAMLGNIVRQMHVHVVARRFDDACWPKPVWGGAPKKEYASGAAEALAARLAGAFEVSHFETISVRNYPQTAMPSFFSKRIFREASHLNGFSGNTIERWSEARGETALADAFAGEAAAVYLFQDDKALIRFNSEQPIPTFLAREAEALALDRDSLILLGVVGDRPRLAAQIGAGASIPDNIKAIDLRSLAIQGLLDPADLGALAQARSYLHWHAANHFCGRCGKPLQPKNSGASRICSGCGAEIFPRVDPVVIMLAIDNERCLLGRQARFAPGMYSALAGFLEPGETIEEAVRREVKEESGIAIGRVAYHSSQAWPFPHSLMIGCHAEALSTQVDRDAEELEDCRWFTREEVRQMLAGTHPDELKAPFPMAIAHHLIAAFAESR